MDDKKGVLSFDLIRAISILKEYKRTQKVPDLLFEHPYLLSGENLENLRNYSAQDNAIDDLLQELQFQSAKSLDNNDLSIVRLVFKENYRTLRTPTLNIIPEYILNHYRIGINPMAVLYQESKSLIRLIKNGVSDLKYYQWLIDIYNDRNTVQQIFVMIQKDIETIKEFIVWFDTSFRQKINYLPPEVYHAKRLKDDLNDHRKVIKETLLMLQK